VAVGLAVAAFLVRQLAGDMLGPSRAARVQRDQRVAEMLTLLDMDPRVREAATQSLVSQVAEYCDTPGLAIAESWYARGLQQYYGFSNPVAAEEAFTRASRMRPQWAWPVNGLGILQFVSGRRGEAMESFERALRLEPGWSRPHSDMAILLRRAGEMSAALDHAQQALAIEPDHPVNHFNYGVILDELGRHAEAREEYLRVLTAAPAMPQAKYNLACSFAREGDASQALAYLAQAIAEEPLFRMDAKEDPDFDPIRDSAPFRAIVDGDDA
jgi:Flp pilus assembly protein TadD